MLEAGRVIDRWIVEEKLGEGGMAIVYRVRHEVLGTRAALKLLTMTHPALRDRFLAEGRVQATLNHPNIVSVADVLTIDGAPALVLEWVDGPTLDEWLGTHEPTPRAAEALFRGILEGVAAAHDAGFVHRDLKPSNILIGPGDIPKVADFGLVKDMADEGATRTGHTMGTPGYMAPEQVRNAKAVDARADVWSLGCILYELVSGERAFSGDDPLEVMTRVTTADCRPISEIAPGLLPRLRRVIDACLVVDRDQRPANAGAVLDLLDRPEEATQSDIPQAKRRDATPAPSTRRPAVTARPTMTAGTSIGAWIVVALLACGTIIGSTMGAGTMALWWVYAKDSDASLADVTGYFDSDTDVPPEAELEPAPEPSAATDPEGPCHAGEGRLIGFAKATPFFLKKGSTWAPLNDKPVFADRPRTENDYKTDFPVVCTLKKGVDVVLHDDPVVIRGAGNWIAIYGGSVRD